MSHVEPDPKDTGAPAEPPAAPPASPPAEPPAAPAAPSHDSKSDTDRLSALESITSNLAETFAAFMDSVKDGGITPESQPQKLPWTHRGGKK